MPNPKKKYDETGGDFGARIVGCDSPDFPLSQHQKAIDEYKANKTALFKKALQLDAESLELETEKAYEHFRLDSPSAELLKYYEKRDRDTAANIIEQIGFEERLQRERKPRFAYIGDISHYDPRYHSLAFELTMKNFKPQIIRMRDVFGLKY